MSVDITYAPVYILGSNEVEAGGIAFNCDNNCQEGSKCCLTSNYPLGCKKCRCQGKKTSCTMCGESCDGFRTNQTVYKPKVTTTMPCDQALRILANYPESVDNAASVQAQCSATKQLSCCKGDETLGASLCGQYWGPTNPNGNCDSIMIDYCNSNPSDSRCNCLKSKLPAPNCTDPACNNSAFKTYSMLNTPCTANVLNCTQQNTVLANGGTIENVTLEQNCTQNNSTSNASTFLSNQSTIIKVLLYILIGVLVFCFFGGAMYFIFFRGSKKTEDQEEIDNPISDDIDVGQDTDGEIVQ